MEKNAGVQHPHERVVVAVRKQNVPRDPRRHSDEQHLLHAKPLEEPRHHQHEDELRHLPERHLSRGVGHANRVQKRVRKRVIELQRNANEERAEHEHRERPVFHQLQRVETKHVGHAHSPGRLGRRMGQEQTEHRQRDRSRGSQLHRPSRRFNAHRADDNPGHDPSERSQHADRREFASRIPHLPERQRVREGERRHVAQRVDEHGTVERPEAGAGRCVEQRDAAKQVKHRQQPLGRKEAIGDHADEERRNHRRQRGGAVGEADLLAGKVERPKPGAHRHVPGAPDEVLEEHHRGELQANG